MGFFHLKKSVQFGFEHPYSKDAYILFVNVKKWILSSLRGFYKLSRWMKMMLIFWICLMMILIVWEKKDLGEKIEKIKGKVIFYGHFKVLCNKIEKLPEGLNK